MRIGRCPAHHAGHGRFEVWLGGTSGHPSAWKGVTVSPVRIRPLGGGVGCLMMILISIGASVLLTVLLNVLAR